MIQESNDMHPLYRERYRLVALPRWRKKLILIRYILNEILFFFETSFLIVRSIIYYFFSNAKQYIVKNVRYGPNDRNVCDIYIPKDSNYITNNKKDCPVILYVHGGSWGFGNKLQYVLLGKKFSERGIVTMIINYTLHPKGNIDDMTDDVDTALSYCYDNIGKYGGDNQKIYLVGQSAGGHIATQYIMENYLKSIDQENQDKENRLPVKKRVPIKGVFTLSAPLDISDHFLFEATRGLEHISPMRPAMKGVKNFDKYSPSYNLRRVKDKSIRDDSLQVPFPSFYILHGERDFTVPLSSSTKFYSILMTKLSNPTARTLLLKSYPKIGHIDFIFNIYNDKLVLNRNIFSSDSDSDDGNDTTDIKSTILNDIVNIIKY